MEILTVLAALIGGVFVHLLASELWCRGPRIATWVITLAVRHLPEQERARYLEEWLAHANDCVGSISKIRHALECLICARALSRVVAQNQFWFDFIFRTEDEKEWTIGFGEDTLIVDTATLRRILAALEGASGSSRAGITMKINGADDLLAQLVNVDNESGVADEVKIKQFKECFANAVVKAFERART